MTTTSRVQRKSQIFPLILKPHAYNDTDLNTKPGTHSEMFWPATGPPRFGGDILHVHAARGESDLGPVSRKSR